MTAKELPAFNTLDISFNAVTVSGNRCKAPEQQA